MLLLLLLLLGMAGGAGAGGLVACKSNTAEGASVVKGIGEIEVNHRMSNAIYAILGTMRTCSLCRSNRMATALERAAEQPL